jgi:ribonuclease VapC
MIIDSSAIVAIVRLEPEAEAMSQAIEEAPSVSMSAAAFLETSIVIGRFRDPLLTARCDALLERTGVAIVPFDEEQARIARQAYRDYGRGSGHRANLNFGDCFTYALARVKREPLLFKGDDFGHTDLRSAMA